MIYLKLGIQNKSQITYFFKSEVLVLAQFKMGISKKGEKNYTRAFLFFSI